MRRDFPVVLLPQTIPPVTRCSSGKSQWRVTCLLLLKSVKVIKIKAGLSPEGPKETRGLNVTGDPGPEQGHGGKMEEV